MSAGFTTLCQAFVDAGRALYAMLSGFVLFVAGVALTPWMWIGRFFTRSATVKVRETPRWERLVNACRRVGEAVLEWTVYSLVAAALIVGLVLGLNNLGAPLRDALTDASNIIYPIIFFLALGVLYLAGWLALRFGTALLAYLSRRLKRQGLYALAVVAVVILAGAVGTILYVILKPKPVIALIAGVALLAGVAGLTLISFGPSGISIFNVGRSGRAPVGPAGRRLHAQARSMKRSSTQTVRVVHQPGVSVQPQGDVSLTIGPASTAAPIGGVDPGKRERKGVGKPWSLPPLSVDRTGVLLVLAVLFAVLLAWGGGEMLLRAGSGILDPAVAPPGPAASPSTPRDNPTPATGSADVIQLGADGEPADVSWRSGYRQLTARLGDGHAVQELSLPTTACGAGAIVVFGAASSDGSAARNDMLARRRASWLADWTHGELSRCPDPVPVVIAVTLGQAQPGSPLSAQRAVRLLALPEEALRKLQVSSDPDMLRDMARASLMGLGEFERFDVCALTTLKAEQGLRDWPPACPDDQR